MRQFKNKSPRVAELTRGLKTYFDFDFDFGFAVFLAAFLAVFFLLPIDPPFSAGAGDSKAGGASAGAGAGDDSVSTLGVLCVSNILFPSMDSVYECDRGG